MPLSADILYFEPGCRESDQKICNNFQVALRALSELEPERLAHLQACVIPALYAEVIFIYPKFGPIGD